MSPHIGHVMEQDTCDQGFSRDYSPFRQQDESSIIDQQIQRRWQSCKVDAVLLTQAVQQVHE
ncbi:hypothetical protein CY34DRAFT_800689 [Suillus luteus UH-Slu-Lm8-n1]|uniref:Uncharacterized protein n=1 Tax=Suillus luteus UH-Slu-Lm8-n1 TaxID=930992 RepID=A0A0D0B8N8_9AGAM|nr:hypothetical protein CY34DRAFT_800689 [Suillus luteus UH-Slu-Lm8-n1]